MMSDSSDEDDQRKAEPTHRMWAESQPGPSRCGPSRQGYCGCCRILYTNLDQHLSSLRHLDSVQASSRCSAPSSVSCRTRLTLLERFLEDVLLHHPHHYNDPRPSHADLLSAPAPPSPKAELDDLCISDDSQSLGTREHLPNSDDASGHGQSAEQQPDGSVCSQSADNRLSEPLREHKDADSAPTEHTPTLHRLAPPTQPQAPPSVHRKAHRKTNRRKTGRSSSSTPPPVGPQPHRDLGTWLSWQAERRETHKDEAFSSDHGDPLDQTIEEVIRMYCVTSTPHQQDETESFQFSLPVTIETQSEDWDSPVQVVLQGAQTLKDTQSSPVQVNRTGGRRPGRLMDLQVDLKDHVYSHHLDSVLHGTHQEGGGTRQDAGFWTLPIEEVLPTPKYIPESFRGKTWVQIEQEDEQRVEMLVRQFRRGKFVCYFDSESLARYGRRGQHRTGCGKNKEKQPSAAVLPLLDHDADSASVKRRRSFRVASRCQVVKVSHGTQTVRLVFPSVRQPAPETTPASVLAASRDSLERTPEVQMWRCLPSSYSNIVSPVQPRTSLVYLLCSPSGPVPACAPAQGSTTKRCRKKRRPLDQQGLKVKYKRLPVRFYDPDTNRILKTPPKGFPWRRGPAPSGPPPTCVRQLFRSLSPDLNTDRAPEDGGAKSHASADAPFSHGSFLRSQGHTSETPPPSSRSERGRGGRKDRTHPQAKRRTRAQTAPRREGLRRSCTGPATLTPLPRHCPTPRPRRRARRGRR